MLHFDSFFFNDFILRSTFDFADCCIYFRISYQRKLFWFFCPRIVLNNAVLIVKIHFAWIESGKWIISISWWVFNCDMLLIFHIFFNCLLTCVSSMIVDLVISLVIKRPLLITKIFVLSALYQNTRVMSIGISRP